MLIEKISLRHTLARNHFSKLSTMAKYFTQEARKEGEVMLDRDIDKLELSMRGRRMSVRGKLMQ